MENKIRLDLLGITSNQIESGVYAVILLERNGVKRIPIIIGASEAQSIQCRLQDIRTPRPLTHDLMVNMMRAYGIALTEVMIRKQDNGIFTADLYLTDGDREIIMDSRSSDAIALAVRMGVPIYTTQQIIDECGFEPEHEKISDSTAQEIPVKNKNTLEKLMHEAVEREDYDEAARIKKELDLLESNTSETIE